MPIQTDANMTLSTSNEPPRAKYFDQSPEDQETSEKLNNEPDQLDDSSEGYISTKDFAYDQSNPLHHGYLQGADDYYEDEDINDEQDKRQSIVLPNDYLINQLAVALYDFEPENDNELGLKEGDVVFISYRHGQGWLVAENQQRTKTGLVPEDFVTYLDDEEDDEAAETARPFYLTQFITQGMTGTEELKSAGNNDEDREDDEWEDVDQLEEEIAEKLDISDK
ncbi:hypothetical protein HG537_0H01140 [Torulaspora globosa]|uniref:SH3 domain-containing protein n=1 Tax=Torulaspora globosa TaxID=48254 RepID=A0A7H9HYA2_9SACH|nr:hypothetical protein HG537_0H01140 [Torulaspora sp. CBS 2947]